jgi:hypothetical protein
MPTPTKEAVERAHHTTQAAEVLRKHIWAIGRATAGARRDEIVVATVEGDLTFGGVWTISRDDLLRQVPLLEGSGWSLLFSSKTPVAEIEERCMQFARIASRKWELMQRWVERQGERSL